MSAAPIDLVQAERQALADFLAVLAAERIGLPHARPRRRDLLDVVNRHDDATRAALEHMRPAQADATWNAGWQLRRDVVAACDRCDRAEEQARWAHED